MTPFPVRLRAAAIVPRWSIIWTIQKDYVASHSLFVVIYTHEIARMIEWTGPRDQLLLMAAVHDLDELITGDLVAPVKHEILDSDKTKQFVLDKMDEILPSIARINYNVEDDLGQYYNGARCILKAADALDAMLFALTERALGNQIIASRVAPCHDRLHDAWMKLPTDNAAELWDKYVSPAIAEHSMPDNYDID